MMDISQVKVVSGTAPSDVEKYLAQFAPFADGIPCDPDKVYYLMPGFLDVHVHFREPGFSYKETIKTGSAAAAHGGYTAVCTMPNLDPVPDSLEHLRAQTNIIERDACISVYPYGAITIGEKGETLSDMADLAPHVIAFSDDGKGVQREEMMRRAMETARSLGKIVAAHCEVNELLRGGYIHDGEYAAAHGHKGISSESEYREIERDLRLAKEIGAAFHVCHISTAESVDLIRKAKAEGVNVTCETAPHYLLLDDGDLREEGNYKMNPPLRSRRDRESLICGLLDGTIDMIATDHAPHSREEKSKGLAGSAFGIVGLETAFPLLYTRLVQSGIISMEKLIDLMAVNPRKRFGIDADGFSLWDLSARETICEKNFLSLGKSTPFLGQEVLGVNIMTVARGRVAYFESKK